MLHKLISFLFHKSLTNVENLLRYPQGKRIYREFHKLRRHKMDPDALKVVHRLNHKGYRAYLVGGCVRDMLFGKNPKDFDVATSAKPEQVRHSFSNSRLIGRRFRIVHIIFRNKIIEVSTFRSLPRHRLLPSQPKRSYLIRRDNRFGTPQEDAARRDFTINGLYFDPRNESIIDYVGGVRDIEKKCIRAIGEANISFQEDPIRMLRACKFAVLLDFTIASKTANAIRRHRKEIQKANKSRLLDELMKIFRTGKSAQIFNVLHDMDLFKAIFPVTANASALKHGGFWDSSVGKRLTMADKVLAEGEDLTTIIFLALLFADVVKEVFSKGTRKHQAEYVHKNIFPIAKRMMFSTKERDRLAQIYVSQSRLLSDPHDKNTRPQFFREKVFFYEAFMVFKINAMVQGDEERIQKAMYWEIGPRMSPPESHRAISTFRSRQRQHEKAHERSFSRKSQHPHKKTNYERE